MKLGILGGGQLGMMMCQEARDLKISTFIFTDTEDSPATKFSDEHIIAQYDDIEKLEIKEYIKDFLKFTFSVINRGKIHEVAAVFTFGLSLIHI